MLLVAMLSSAASATRASTQPEGLDGTSKESDEMPRYRDKSDCALLFKLRAEAIDVPSSIEQTGDVVGVDHSYYTKLLSNAACRLASLAWKWKANDLCLIGLRDD